MTTVAISHGYPPLWNMGGEVSLHRSMTAVRGKRVVLTNTQAEYYIDGIQVKQIDTPNVLDINADPAPITNQLKELEAKAVIAQNELSLPAVYAARESGAISIVSVHTPPRYGGNIKKAVFQSDYAIYNTQAAATKWNDLGSLVLHPPINPMPRDTKTTGDAYTLLSSLVNKGVQVVLDLAKTYPDKRFIIVRSPAEPTHGLVDLEDQAAKLPNVELLPRVSPDNVYKYLEQTKILLVPSKYETYGMSAIEAAGYGIPSIHVDTPDVREGIGEAAYLIKPLSFEGAIKGITEIEANYSFYSDKARTRAKYIEDRQLLEMQRFADFIANIKKPEDRKRRQRALSIWMR
jgi:hypothetical protein